jgi:hypothetical protein
MLIVRNRFVAKPGHASKLAAQLKEAMVAASIGKHRVLTDVTGDFNQVILESELKDLGEFDAMLKEYYSNSSFRDKMKGYADFWTKGNREIFQVV